MTERLAALIVSEGKWLPVAMSAAALSVGLLWTLRGRSLPRTQLVMAAMNLFSGVMLGVMGFGHLLAVTTKLMLGTLEGAPLVLYPIGIAIIVPSWLLVDHTHAIVRGAEPGRKTTGLNAWLAITLLVLGVHNLPLAAPSLLNIGYRLHSRRVTGWAIVSVAVVFNLALFIGAVVFMASGQSFEQFSGME